jgi:predicted AAA+ superfamily ATPase
MKRFIDHDLAEWSDTDERKPLLLRGARQVGKTFAARQLGKSFASFVEINCEEMPACRTVFEKDLNPTRIIQELSLLTGKKIIPGKTLLFLDEIQDAPQIITALRYFYEKLPELHVIAAGSLLDFALENTGIPVGRVESLYVYPLSWLEFLLAQQEDLLYHAILEQDVQTPIGEAIHQKLLHLLGEYLAIGGMPEVVALWIKKRNPFLCFKTHQSLLSTYRQDFEKYAKKYQIKYVDLLFDQIPRQLGRRFKFSAVPGEYRKRELQPCFNLLIKANMLHPINHTAANGLPLGAESNTEHFKTIFLDIGLAQALLGLDLKEWFLTPHQAFANQGAIVEAFVGQEMLVYASALQKKQLYYWHKESLNAQAEIDYVLQQKNKIIPIEVKSGTTGQLKSLREFLNSHTDTPYALRFSSHNYSCHGGIHSYPLYAIARAMQFNSSDVAKGQSLALEKAQQSSLIQTKKNAL